MFGVRGVLQWLAGVWIRSLVLVTSQGGDETQGMCSFGLDNVFGGGEMVLLFSASVGG